MALRWTAAQRTITRAEAVDQVHACQQWPRMVSSMAHATCKSFLAGSLAAEWTLVLLLQLAACDVTVVSVEDIPPEELERERQLEAQKEDLASKPEKFR